jgi:hypothetical protein
MKSARAPTRFSLNSNRSSRALCSSTTSAEFKHTSQEGVEHIKRVQKAVNDAKPGMIIRVGAGALANSQLNRGGKQVEVGYEVRQVGSFEEAKQLADEFLG